MKVENRKQKIEIGEPVVIFAVCFRRAAFEE